jgi:hypothetical protein
MSYVTDFTSTSSMVNEGETASFTFRYVSLGGLGGWTPIANTYVPYKLSGSINAADISGGTLSGNVITNSNGVGTISVTLLNDNLTEGPETLTVTPGTNSSSLSITINDTSTGLTTNSSTTTPLNNTNFTGTTGNDVIAKLPGFQNINGLGGTDMVVYGSNSTAVVISKTSFGLVTIVMNSVTGETDNLYSIERLKFADTAIALDTDGVGGKAYRVYQAAFNRTPDVGGLGYWIGRMDSGVSLSEVAQGFVSSAEFKALYGANPTTTQMAARFYDNVLHRAPDSAGYNYWLSMLNAGMSFSQALALFSESPENVSGVSAVIQNGMRYTPDATSITLLSKAVTLVGVGGGFDSGNGGGDSGGG